ncbi:MAG: hypothetical protein RL339_2128 [Pseudomonadota bacterium]
MAPGLRHLARDQGGNVSPLYALVLMVLIALAGIGFDYGRMVAMQSELQNAVDQAALAAATQLDGHEDAMIRARAAAVNTFATATSEFANITRIANDDGGRTVSGLNFTFYESYADDAPGAEVTSDADGGNAHVVEVTTTGRQVFYALTPVIGAISSGGMRASAMAMLKKAGCNVPSIMVCVDRSDFPLPAEEGKGLRMRWKSSKDVTPLAPGNWGFLDIEGVRDSQYEMGENAAPRCFNLENLTTEPGFRNTEPDALNTRFDMPTNKLQCQDNGDFCPSENTRKNYAVAFTGTVISPKSTLTIADVRAALTCPAKLPAGKQTWVPFSSIGVIDRTASDSFTLDNCFFTNTCTYLGDGTWDIDRYLAGHHPGVLASSFTKGSRYEVYQWEKANKAARLGPELVGFNPDSRPRLSGTNYRHSITYHCSYSTPQFSSPVIPSDTQKDRRVLTVGAAKCEGISGRKQVELLGWMDVFLLDPSDPADPGTIRAEVIGPALRPDNLSGFQYFGKDRAVLIR